MKICGYTPQTVTQPTQNQLIRAILEQTTQEASGKRSNHRNATLPSQIPHKRGRNANFDENLIFFDRRFFDDSTRGREIAAAGRGAGSSEHRWDFVDDHETVMGQKRPSVEVWFT